jgi:hypothetical protein
MGFGLQNLSPCLYMELAVILEQVTGRRHGMLKSICTATYTFQSLIERGCLYVDKTEYLWRLVSNPDGIFFLSRPRRFGKSLFLSTLDAFFSGKKELFKGLAVEKLAPTVWEKYPVIRLSMVSAPTVATLEKKLMSLIADAAHANRVPCRGDLSSICFKNLITDLYDKTGKQVVILIDEYDKPILDVISTPTAGDTLKHLREFYQEIKSANDKERFVFITGVTKFAHTSIFSDLNNLTDITRSAEYATMLGYTHDELLSNFSEYIDDTAQFMGKSRDTLVRELTEWYDGFRFEETAQSVFNPVSVGKFFINRKFGNYWYDTGTPNFLVQTARQRPFELETMRNAWVPYSTFDKYDIDRLDPFLFAVQTGYLSMKDAKAVRGQQRYRFDFPNKEIRDSFSSFLLEVTTNTTATQTTTLLDNLANALAAGDVDGFMSPLRPVIAGLPWGNLGDDGGDPTKFYEGYFRNLLTLTFSLIDVDNTPEVRTSDGLIDLVARYQDYTFVLELKMKRKEDDTERLLDAALQQAIDEKHYAEKYQNLSKHIKIVAVVFDADSRRLVAWKSVDAK